MRSDRRERSKRPSQLSYAVSWGLIRKERQAKASLREAANAKLKNRVYHFVPSKGGCDGRMYKLEEKHQSRECTIPAMPRTT